MALGYLSGKATSKLLKVNVNVPTLFLVSILPDIDLLIPFLAHRGPIHSILITTLVFLPIFLFFGNKAAPYYIAMAQHSIVGDYLTDQGIQLLWPITEGWYGVHIPTTSSTNILLEWTFFLVSLVIMLRKGDIWILFKNQMSNFVLAIPVITVLLPPFLSYPISAPLELVFPHLIYLTLFIISILNTVRCRLRSNRRNLVGQPPTTTVTNLDDG